MTDAPKVIGVIGSGVMGAGIAQLGCLAGAETLLFDSSAEGLAKAAASIERNLGRGAERGRWSEEEARAAAGRLRTVDDIGALEPAAIVIEAVPEVLEIKHQVLAELPGDPVIASNTSSLSVTAIAAPLERPGRVVGMHFFNPPPLMKLVELVAGSETEPAALELARATALAMGRTPIVARDAIGFVVNRGGRPFYTEGMRLLEEGLADAAQIDRVYRMGAGFRMGPFELMDLVGLDTGLAIADVFTSRSLGEPRWKPGEAQRRMVTAGRFGRKNGRGWFDYRDGPHREDDPEPPAGNGGAARTIAVLGEGAEADGLRARAEAHGFAVEAEPSTEAALTIVTELARAGAVTDGDTASALAATLSGGATDPGLAATVPTDTVDPRAAAIPGDPPNPALPVAIRGDRVVLVNCAEHSLAAAGVPEAVGYHLLPPAAEATVLELTATPSTPAAARGAAEDLAAALGLHAEWVGDAPGLVLGRVVAQLVNEGCFSIGAGIASPEDVDLSLTLGLNHPFGPIAWGERIGWDAVLGRIDALYEERHEERYRAAPLLRRAAQLGISPRELFDPQHPAWR
jgi:3-hydroxybutyryl-CoA dehydrogenase